MGRQIESTEHTLSLARNVIDGAIEVDSLEVSTGDADESNNSFLYDERFGQRKERMKVNTCEYDSKSEYSVLYVERFGQRKQSLGANTYGSISSLKVDEFGRADNCKSSLKVDEFGRARSDDSLKAEKFSRVGCHENGLEAEEFGRARSRRYHFHRCTLPPTSTKAKHPSSQTEMMCVETDFGSYKALVVV
mmetsp:Transcript_18477/g.27848  ORF Transcript_18477/g.27848 Transcript_18477/m.27848 type:complete len:191 (+) Transcript_18477:792-1364(+)